MKITLTIDTDHADDATFDSVKRKLIQIGSELAYARLYDTSKAKLPETLHRLVGGPEGTIPGKHFEIGAQFTIEDETDECDWEDSGTDAPNGATIYTCQHGHALLGGTDQ